MKCEELPPMTPWQYHEPSDCLYFRHDQGTTEYQRTRGTSRRSRNRGIAIVGEIGDTPSDMVDTIIWRKVNIIYISGHQADELYVT
jgi:hypothetical protein